MARWTRPKLKPIEHKPKQLTFRIPDTDKKRKVQELKERLHAHAR